MPAFKLLGRIPAIALFVALPGAIAAQPAASSSQSAALDLVSATGASSTSGASVEATMPALTLEQKGDYLYVQRKYQEAIETYAKVEKPTPSVWNKMGIAYQMLFDVKSAARCYKQALKLDPDNAHSLNNLATLDDARNDFASAERLYRRALKVEPNSARVFKNLGVNLLMQHRFAESSEAFSQALALDPHSLDPHYGPTVETSVSVRDRAEESYLQARSCARAGLNDCAIDHLRRAFNEGSATRQKVESEEDFAALRQLPEYGRLLEEQQ